MFKRLLSKLFLGGLVRLLKILTRVVRKRRLVQATGWARLALRKGLGRNVGSWREQIVNLDVLCQGHYVTAVFRRRVLAQGFQIAYEVQTFNFIIFRFRGGSNFRASYWLLRFFWLTYRHYLKLTALSFHSKLHISGRVLLESTRIFELGHRIGTFLFCNQGSKLRHVFNWRWSGWIVRLWDSGKAGLSLDDDVATTGFHVSAEVGPVAAQVFHFKFVINLIFTILPPYSRLHLKRILVGQGRSLLRLTMEIPGKCWWVWGRGEVFGYCWRNLSKITLGLSELKILGQQSTIDTLSYHLSTIPTPLNLLCTPL